MEDSEGLFGDDNDATVEEVVKEKVKFYNSTIQSSSSDGGRMVIASEYMPAGTLVACEWPFITWSDLNFEDAQSVYAVLRSIFDNRPMHARTLTLYPQQLTPQLLQDEINPHVASKSLIHDVLAINLQSPDIIPTDEVYRLILVLQHNAFDSGLYDYLSMFNHSCQPNCMKFSPSSKSRGASEIWTTKEVQAGEELFISYYQPMEDKISSMHEYLLRQHHFHCHCARCTAHLNLLGSPAEAPQSNGSKGVDVYDEVYDAVSLAQDSLSAIIQQEQDVHTLYIHDQEEDIPIHKIYAHVQSLYAYILSPSAASPLQALAQGGAEGVYAAVHLSRTLVNLCAKYHELYFQPNGHVQPHTHEHSHILTVHTVWIVSTLYLIQKKMEYAGSDHPDFSMHFQDVLNSYETIAGIVKEHHLHVLDYLDTLNSDVGQLSLVFPSPAPSLPKTYKPPHVLASLLSACQKTYPQLYTLYAHCLSEKTRLEKLYHLVKRYPDIAFVKKVPGAVYLGKA